MQVVEQKQLMVIIKFIHLQGQELLQLIVQVMQEVMIK
jgi:hypothetical protein